ncbi:MAG: DNA translocase FtsK 4TM domain-containing protein, partial [Candidatus Omnitrophica bacterium]|nr:DNA translocase FtsK 4TM domain-containing protein [Candidatus Omnitrophota bacterium]
MRERRLNEIKGVILVAVGLIVLASLISFTPFDLGFYTSHPNIPPHNLIRGFGAYLAGALLFLFGWASFVIPVFIFFLGVKFFRHDAPSLRFPRTLGLGVLLLSVSSLVGLIYSVNNGKSFSFGGFLGFIISRFISSYLGRLGAFIVLTTLVLLSLALGLEVLISTFLLNIFDRGKLFFSSILNFKMAPHKKDAVKIKDSTLPEAKPKINVAIAKPLPPAKPKIQIMQKEELAEDKEIKARPKELKIGDYHLPTLDLLDSPPPFEARQIKEDLASNARVLEETLEDFGIAVKVTDIERGPVITRYELEPAPGVKLNRIVALNDDISLAMKAPSVRIVAPIPGKARVGVEVPNIQSSLVYLKEILASKEFQEADSKLTLALGKDIAGHSVVADLGQMPHLLIAGTTGSGKTVCVNSLIVSLLLRATPNELKLLMVDPKMVELAPFNGLPHLICPVVTDAKKAAVALGWVVNEMEERYQLLAKAGARNIESYNEKQEHIPYIIVIIDE